MLEPLAHKAHRGLKAYKDRAVIRDIRVDKVIKVHKVQLELPEPKAVQAPLAHKDLKELKAPKGIKVIRVSPVIKVHKAQWVRKVLFGVEIGQQRQPTIRMMLFIMMEIAISA